MRTEDLGARVDQLRERLGAALRSPEPRTTACLSYPEIRRLVLDPEHTDPAPRRHLETGPRCRQLFQAMQAAMVHLSTPFLVRRQLGRLTAEEEALAAYHLVQGGCSECNRRAQGLAAALGAVLNLSGPWFLPHPGAARAAEAAGTHTAQSPDARIEAEVVTHAEGLLLTIRTRDPEMAAAPVFYELQGDPGNIEGVCRLEPDVEGWYAAEIPLEAGPQTAPLSGEITVITVAAVPPDALSAPERQRWTAPPEVE